MKITVLASPGNSTNILLNWLTDNGYTDVQVIQEDNVSAKAIIKYRARRLGWIVTGGQIAFMTLVLPFLQRAATRRIKDLLEQNNLKLTPFVGPTITVDNINDPKVISYLTDRQPNVVLVNGTRIIRDHILSAIHAPFLNTHAGITPAYRGVHGGYWALWNNDPENFGVTLHLVDAGVDTGGVLAQERTTPSSDDNFCTYPLLQQAISFPALKRQLQILESKKQIEPFVVDATDSNQWYHPTIWQYLLGRLRGVK